METWYIIYDQELLAIIKVFKTWRHYLMSYKNKVFVFIDHNNLCQDFKEMNSIWVVK